LGKYDLGRFGASLAVNTNDLSTNRAASLEYWDGYWRDAGANPRWREVAPEVVDLIERETPGRRPDVLDLGCGLGRNAIAFAQAGYRVTAADASSVAGGALQTRAKEAGVTIKFVLCDFADDLFPDESFDLVVSIDAIHHGDRAAFFRSIANVCRWLKHGGLFLFTSPVLTDHDRSEQWREIASRTLEVEPGHVHYHPSRSDLEKSLSGLRLLSCNRVPHRWEREGLRYDGVKWQVLAQRP